MPKQLAELVPPYSIGRSTQYSFKKHFMAPFSEMGFNCLKATDTSQEDSLILIGCMIFRSPFLDVKRMFMTTVSFLA